MIKNIILKAFVYNLDKYYKKYMHGCGGYRCDGGYWGGDEDEVLLEDLKKQSMWNANYGNVFLFPLKI